MGAAHSRAPNGARSREPTGASHGLSHTLANVASCVLISFESAPRSQGEETHLLASGRRHGPGPPSAAPRTRGTTCTLTSTALTGRPLWLGLLGNSLQEGRSLPDLSFPAGGLSVRPPQIADVRAQHTEGLCPQDTKQSLGAGRRPLASLPPSQRVSGGTGGLKQEGRWRPEEPACLP